MNGLAPALVKRESPPDGARFIPKLVYHDRALADRLAGKKVFLVFDDNQFMDGSGILKFMIDEKALPSNIHPMSWSSLIRSLPDLTADIIAVASIHPAVISQTSAMFAEAAAKFRVNNPRACIIMVTLYSELTPPGAALSFLKGEGLVDHLEPGPVTYGALLHNGLEASRAAD
jgi:hypothetical protein